MPQTNPTEPYNTPCNLNSYASTICTNSMAMLL